MPRQAGFQVTETSKRYLAIIELIPRHPSAVTVHEIVKKLNLAQFKTSVRGIQRDLQKLAEAYPLECQFDGRRYLWSFGENVPVTIFPAMDTHLALSFGLMERSMVNLLAPVSYDSLKQLFDKARLHLAQHPGAEARWVEKVYIHPIGMHRIPPIFNDEFQAILMQAILDEWVLQISLRRGTGSAIDRHTISPQGLVIQGTSTQVVCWSHTKNKIIAFGLHQIFDIDFVENVNFHAIQGFELKSYVEEESGAEPVQGSTDLKIRLLFDAGYPIQDIIDSPIGTAQTVTQRSNKSSLVEAKVSNTIELRRWLLSNGSQCEVLGPKFLRDEIRDQVMALSTKYK